MRMDIIALIKQTISLLWSVTNHRSLIINHQPQNISQQMWIVSVSQQASVMRNQITITNHRPRMNRHVTSKSNVSIQSLIMSYQTSIRQDQKSSMKQSPKNIHQIVCCLAKPSNHQTSRDEHQTPNNRHWSSIIGHHTVKFTWSTTY